MRWLVVILSMILLWGVPVARAQDRAPLRRFGLFIGNNYGGSERQTLKYAVSDAQALKRVLEELGGLTKEDGLLLSEPDVSAIERAIATQIERIRDAGTRQRTELIFYYSGHSDTRGMLLGDALVPYATLKGWLEQVPADVRIVLLDSCSAGTLTRLKGGSHRPPFLFDESVEVRGHAILTASAEDEAAQESDRIGGSFFTHYLISGLRGAADSSADGRVTLTEAYRFAHDETLARTGATEAGAQHPSFDIQLAGTGDLVITDLRETRARLEILPDVAGHLFIRDDRDRVIAELNKPRGTKVVLGFAPGRYQLSIEAKNSQKAASADLVALTTASVGAASFREVPLELAVARGGRTELVPVGVSLLPPYDTYHRRAGAVVESYLGFHAVYGAPDVLHGAQLGLFANGVEVHADGVQLAFAANLATRLRGAQVTFGGNAVREFLRGIQLAGLGNLVRGEARGLQVAFAYNSATQLEGLQAGALNISRAASHGLTFGGLNIARDLRGVQAGFVNWAKQLRGPQLGLLNMSDHVRGVQVGFINIARGNVHGAQVGLFNYADSVDAGIGPFTITRDGGAHAQFVSGDVSAFQLALRLDARYTYSFFGVGLHPFGSENQRTYMFGAGFGGKIPIASIVSAELDAAGYVVQPVLEWIAGAPNGLTQARLLARVEIDKHLSLLLGGSFNVLFQGQAQTLTPGFDQSKPRATEEDDQVQVRYWPGWVFGLRL